MAAEASEAKSLAQAIRDVAERAHNEEELRIGVEKLLEPVLQRLGVEAQPRYERHIGRTVFTAPGRADALYGQAIIEYEPPGKLSTPRGLASTRKQLEDYLLGLAPSGSQREAALRRLAGIGLDGRNIFFLRYRGDRPSTEQAIPQAKSTQLPLLVEEAPKGTFSLVGPYSITEESVSEFLLHLRALRRRPLAADELAKEFGPAGDVAHEIVNALYNRLAECLTAPGSPFPRVQALYDEWERIFGIVYGQELVKAQRDAQALARLYHVTEFTDLKPLLFAVHTYYALLMKLLAAELLSLQQGALLASIAEELPALPAEQLRSRLEDLEKGAWFEAQGIRNFLEADFFGWYLSAWSAEIEGAVRRLARALAEYEPATGTLAPEATRDLLKKLYQYLVPKELRHDLGEYYTPDWLAELVLNEVGYTGNPEERLLDPACGSGTFLVLALRRILDHAQDSLAWRTRERELAAKILENVVGFDLNPLAVIAARTNYLLALGPLARHLAGKDLPVYLCDSILTPKTIRPMQVPPESPDSIPVPSSQREFWIPRELVELGRIDDLCRLLEQCVASYTLDEFVERARREIGWANEYTEPSLRTLFLKVKELEAVGRNGLWARLIKNAFAPVFRAATPFDYVAGNPPWVNWESLSDDYRAATRQLWQDYGLFSLKGHAARLGGGKKDISMLMLYAAMDSYLKDAGRLGFVITQTVFKTKGAGDGFRRFRLGGWAHLKVLSAHDLVELQPFEGATNRTALVVLQKGEPTEYPARYVLWQKTLRVPMTAESGKPGRIAMDSTLSEVEARTKRTTLSARPVNAAEPTSPWLTASPAALAALQKAVGPSAYRAHAGACTWLNGVYWLKVLEKRSDGLLVVENLHDVGKIRVKKVTAAIEPGLVYPLLRGRDISRWRSQPSAYILMVQDPIKRTGYDESWLKENYPQTFDYLKQFEDVLRQRSGYKKYFEPEKDPFYSMYDVADYTFAPYKVVWREQASELTVAAVSTKDKPSIPDHKLMLVPCSSSDEASYLVACLNSGPSRLVVQAYVVAIGMSTHVLEHVAIPKFDAGNRLHRELAALSQRAHQLAAKGFGPRSLAPSPSTERGKEERWFEEAEAELRQVEEEIDRLAARLWGITEGELAEIRRALVELKAG